MLKKKLNFLDSLADLLPRCITCDKQRVVSSATKIKRKIFCVRLGGYQRVCLEA